MDTPGIAFTLNDRRINSVIRWLIYLAIIFTLLSITGQLYKSRGPVFSETLEALINKTDLDVENNIPTYFASMLLLFNSTILGVITFIKWKEKNYYKAKWMILALVFLFLSMEEIVGFHESVMALLRSLLQGEGFFYFTWVIPAIILVGLFGFWYIPFLVHLPKRTRLLFILSGSIYIAGAVGFEMLGGKYFSDENFNVLLYSMITTLEEDLEFTGIICFIYTLLKYLQSMLTGILFLLPVDTRLVQRI
jgi:hypothetical protein